MEGHASISNEILARYAADAARDVAGVRKLVDNPILRHRGSRVVESDDGVGVELQIGLEWGASAPDVARAVQQRVRDYLIRMADLEVRSIDVVVAEIG